MKYLIIILSIVGCSCICGGGAPTPTVTPGVDSRTYIQFPTNTGLVNATQYYIGGALASYGNYGLASYKLDGDGSIQFRYIDNNSEGAIIGFNSSAISQDYNNYEVFTWVSAGLIYTGGFGESNTSRGVISDGNYLRISRTGSVFKVQKSTNDTTYTDVYTFSYSSSSTMYINCNVYNSKRLTYCSGIGLSTYTGGSGIGRNLDTLVVCDGNSLTQQGYPLILNGILSDKSSVLNYAVGGQNTTQMASDVTSQIDVLYKIGRKNYLVAWEVGNDILTGGKAYDAYVRFAAYCNARRAIGWTVIAITCPPRIGVNDDTLQLANNYLLSNYTTFCDKIVDTRSDSRLATITSTYWSTDSVHLNTAGYTVIANLVKNKIIN